MLLLLFFLLLGLLLSLVLLLPALLATVKGHAHGHVVGDLVHLAQILDRGSCGCRSYCSSDRRQQFGSCRRRYSSRCRWWRRRPLTCHEGVEAVIVVADAQPLVDGDPLDNSDLRGVKIK